jgi:hypothetical protein
MKNSVLWNVTPCSPCKNRRFVPSSPILVTLIMEALISSETSDFTRASWRNIPEDAILYSHRLVSDRAVISQKLARVKARRGGMRRVSFRPISTHRRCNEKLHSIQNKTDYISEKNCRTPSGTLKMYLGTCPVAHGGGGGGGTIKIAEEFLVSWNIVSCKCKLKCRIPLCGNVNFVTRHEYATS